MKKIGKLELNVLSIIGDSLQKIDITKAIEEQLETFLIDIGMIATERMVTQSFVIARKIPKINYENIIWELHKMFPNVMEDSIEQILKANFKDWLKIHPELVENYPKISFTDILKVFAKRWK